MDNLQCTIDNELKPYGEYKKSQIPWIGELPEHWNYEKLYSRFKERRVKVSDKDYKPLSVTKHGIVLQLSTAAKSNDGDNRKLVKKGDFVINSRSDRKGSSGLSGYDGSVSLINTVLEPYEIDSKYAHYLLKSNNFIEEFYRNGRGIVADLWTTRFYEMRNIYIPIPSRTEQDQIVKYLDSKLVKINKFIKAKKKLVDVLKEQKQAVINEAVTKGINQDVKMKSSGIEWLGEIPEHWNIRRCKFLFSEVDNRSEFGNETHLSMSQKHGLVPDNELEERRLLSENYIGAKICQKDDIVLNRLKAHLGVFALSPQTGVVSPDYTVLRPNKFIYPKFAEYALKSQACRGELCKRVKGIVMGFWRLYTDDFYNIVLPLPTYDEQKNIVGVIEEKLCAIDCIIIKAQQEIDLITEYRTRLISDVVTGKIDVRHIVIDEAYSEDSDLSAFEDEDPETEADVADDEEGEE